MDLPPAQKVEAHQYVPQQQSSTPRFYQDDTVSYGNVSDDVNVLNQIGKQCGQQGAFDRGLAALDKAIQMNNQTPESFYNRGYIYNCLGNFPQAIDDYSSALAIDENYGPAYNDRALAYEAQGEFEKAIADFERSLQLRPGHTYTLRNLAMAYYHVGRLADAERMLQEVAAPKPIKALVLQGLIQQAKGESAQMTWEETKACPLAEELTLETSGNYYWHAVAAYYRGEYAQAERLVSGAIQFRPDTFAILPGSILKQGHRENALSSCHQLLKQVPGAYPAWIVLADIHLQNKDNTSAKKAIQTASALLPTNPLILEWQKKVLS